MAQQYHCYFPDRGEVAADSRPYLADSLEEAAQQAAKEKCQQDVEWATNRVVVYGGRDRKHKWFDVEVVSVPEFVAKPLRL